MLEILAGMLRTAAPILLAAMGGVVFEKSGVFTIAHEGIMLFGAFFGVLGVYLTASPLMGVAFALTAGAVCGLIYIWLTERMGANATIVSIGINTLAIGATTYMMKMIFGDAGTVGNPRIIGLPRISIPLFDRVPFLDKVLNNHTACFCFSEAAALIFCCTALFCSCSFLYLLLRRSSMSWRSSSSSS